MNMNNLMEKLVENYNSYSYELCQNMFKKLSIEQQNEILNKEISPYLITKIWKKLNIDQIKLIIKLKKITKSIIDGLRDDQYNEQYNNLSKLEKETLWLDHYIASNNMSDEEYIIHIWPLLDIYKQIRILKNKQISINFLKKFMYSFKSYKDGTMHLETIIKYQYITEDMMNYMWIYLNDDLKHLLCKTLINRSDSPIE